MKSWLSWTILALAVMGAPGRGQADGYVDTHAHLVESGTGVFAGSLLGAADAAVKEMDRLGYAKAILMPTPQIYRGTSNHDFEAFKEVQQKHPGRFAVLGGGYLLNALIHKSVADGRVDEDDRKLFIRNAEMILASGAVGFGELAAEHYSIGKFAAFHAYESAPPDHELFLLLADIAAQHDVPIDLHAEILPQDMPLPATPALISPPNPAQLKANLAGFERLLAHNRKAKIIWVHAGWDLSGTRDLGLMTRLMRTHPNLYMSFKIAGKPGAPKSKPLGPDGRLKPEWLGFIQEFSDRLLIGTDEFYQAASVNRVDITTAAGLTELPVRLVQQLPPELGRKIGYENAMRLYKLGPTSN
ncbi:MAG: amidohydrolase family protein [Pseudomonadota bacterium]